MNAANEALFVPRIVTGDRRKTEYFDVCSFNTYYKVYFCLLKY